MPAFAPATDVSEIVLPEPGKYYVKCVAIEDAPDKGFGPGVKWIFQLTDFISGEPWGQELWQFTSIKMGPKARARPIIEGLLGRPLDVAKREVPDTQQLIGRTMIAMVIHEPRDDGSPRAVVTSCKPYTQDGPAPTPARPAPVASPGNGLIDQVKGAMRKATILQTHRHLELGAIDDAALSKMSDSDLYSLLEDINLDIQTS